MMDKKVENSGSLVENNNRFFITLVIGIYLVIDVIVLFALCLSEIYLKVDHQIVLMLSFVIEFFGVLYVSTKGNIKSSIILYILLLVSPAFIGLIAMGMYALTKNVIPFTPTVLYAFRTGYTLNWEMLNNFMRAIITFRIPALVSIVVSLVFYLFTRKKQSN